jgi:hypothetical protein
MPRITTVNRENAELLWEELGDIPTDENECIEEEFAGFPAGTHREEIWHWFEDTFGLSVAKDLMFKEKTGDVAVYHCHDQGCLMEFHFQIRSDISDSGWMAFDIRDLKRALHLTHTTHQGIILAALEQYGPPLEQVIDTLIEWYDGETES